MAKKNRDELKNLFSGDNKYPRITPSWLKDLLDSVFLKENDEGPTGPSGPSGPEGPTGPSTISVVGASISPTAPGTTGEMLSDGTFFYIAVDTDEWIRFGPGSTNW